MGMVFGLRGGIILSSRCKIQPMQHLLNGIHCLIECSTLMGEKRAGGDGEGDAMSGKISNNNEKRKGIKYKYYIMSINE